MSCNPCIDGNFVKWEHAFHSHTKGTNDTASMAQYPSGIAPYVIWVQNWCNALRLLHPAVA
ncbi:hypothetical protein [Nitrosomonas sp. Nm34]|uniref:hypothetical protein n=1 Tax=Nitrosomonas sp. Nm34 TaxID=1881055 RepID=UPI0011134399|nr:hypothetical protein [Nitrosomonas sp. Nm34]